MAIPEDWVRWGGVACWVARVRSLAIPGFVGEAGWQGLVGGGDRLLGGASTEPRDPGLGRRGWLAGGNCVLLERKCCGTVLW